VFLVSEVQEKLGGQRKLLTNEAIILKINHLQHKYSLKISANLNSASIDFYTAWWKMSSINYL